MKKAQTILLCVALLFLFGRPAWGQLSAYTFTVGTGTLFNTTGATLFLNGNIGNRTTNRNRTSGVLPLGFTFTFNGANYTQFSISSNGVMALGGANITNSPTNSLTGGGAFPRIAPFWDGLSMGGIGNNPPGCGTPKITHLVSGIAPFRVLIVEWTDNDVDWITNRNSHCTFQARLYETLNKIEFYYDRMSSCDVCGGGLCVNTSVSIGIAAASNNFVSITPGNGTATRSSVSVNNFYNLNVATTAIPNGTLYTLVPCSFYLVGRTGAGDGGTTLMANGDTFFNGTSAQVGSSTVFKPFYATTTTPGCSKNYTMTIAGPAAADYYFDTPGTQAVTRSINGSLADTVAITFTPQATGVRNATLTVSDGASYVRSYNLAAYAPLVNFSSNAGQGGTTNLNDGDTLIKGVLVPRHGSQAFTPFTLTNVSAADQAIDYTITDPSGQYTISPDTVIPPAGTATPLITFAPTGFGSQSATLNVNAGGEQRTFVLNAISEAPGADLTAGGTLIDSNATLFTNSYACVGDAGSSLEITLVNTGYHDFVISGAEFYQIDTSYGQGRPAYPFRRDANDALIPARDYLLTLTPGVAPFGANALQFPYVVPQGATQTIYLTFLSQRPEKRFARGYIRTNGESRASSDTDGVVKDGLLSFGLFGRGMGSSLSDNKSGGLPKGITFPETRIGSTSDAALHIVNPGACPLRISLPFMKVTTGDVDEFSIVSVPTRGIDPVTGDLVLAPGGSDSVVLRFRPRQFGSRRAGIYLVTNDSTIEIPGIVERGTYPIDLFGMGQADMYSEDIDFGVALIGGGVKDQVRRVARLKNTQTKPATVVAMFVEGVDTTDFKQDLSNPWPTLPIEVNAGQELDVSLAFSPAAGGQAGGRGAVMVFVMSTGDTIRARLTGTAGTRTIAVTPATLNMGPISTGHQSRTSIMISNSGTMPLTLQSPALSVGSDFSIGNLPRLVLAPGQNEYLEVTYSPQTPGGSNASITIANNATNGTVQVNLNGTATRPRRKEFDPGRNLWGGHEQHGGEVAHGANVDLSRSAVAGEDTAPAIALYQSVPNPANDRVEIGYRIASPGDVRLELYDVDGGLVKEITIGNRPAGEGYLQLDIRDLAAGLYQYRLLSGGESASRTMTVVK